MYFCNICLIRFLSLYSFTLIRELVAETTSVCHLIILQFLGVGSLLKGTLTCRPDRSNQQLYRAVRKCPRHLSDKPVEPGQVSNQKTEMWAHLSASSLLDCFSESS